MTRPTATGPSGPTVLGIDFGTSNTVAALAGPGRAPRVLSVDGAGWLPSAVFLDDDGTLAVGRDAERRARLAPERFEANPKRRIDDGDLMLGSRVIPVADAIAAVLHRVAGEARRQLANRPPDLVTLTHPAGWGSTRRAVLLDAARKAGLGQRITLLPEPVAAAVHFASLRDGESGAGGPALAVYDLGGGTFDCAVVRTENSQYTVAADDGLSDVGGVDFDQALLDQLGRVKSASEPGRWRALLRPQSAADRRAARALHEDVRSSKESLSRYAQAEVALPEPFTDALLSRQEFEGLIRPMVARTVEVLSATIATAGYRPEQLAGIYLVGGSSRIPLVGAAIADRTGVVPTTLEQPETAVALGAALWPAAQHGRATGPMTGSPSGPASGPTPGQGSGPQRQASGPIPPAGSLRPPGGPGPARPATSGHPGAPGGAGQFRGAGRSGPGPDPRGLPLPPKKSRRGMLVAGGALVLALLVAVTLIVLNNRDTTAGPGGGTGTVTDSGDGGVTDSGVTDSGVMSGPDSGKVTTSGPTGDVDPTRCTVDIVDDQGLTPCMVDFAGGLVSGAFCSNKAEDIGLEESQAAVFGSLAPAWQYCVTEDEKYSAVLLQTANENGREISWETMFSLMAKPQSCGEFLTGGRSRGVYVVGSQTVDDVPVLYWQDTALPLLGIWRPPGEEATVDVDQLIADFDDSSGFRLTEMDCAGIVPETGGGDCATAPLDDNYMTPCIQAVSGDAAAQASMCFPGDKMQSQFTSDEFPLVAAAACSFTRDTFTASAIYLQAGNVDDAAGFFEQLAGEDNSEITDWSQGGMSGRTFSQIDADGLPSVVWTFADSPVVVFAGGSPSGDVGKDEIVQPLQELFTSVLLPQD